MQTFLRFFLAVLLLETPRDFLFTKAQDSASNAVRSKELELSRAARPWEFLASVGKKAGLLGNESGVVEAWVYPLKVLRDLRLTIHTKGREIPAESLVRTVIARPESTTLVYVSDTF